MTSNKTSRCRSSRGDPQPTTGRQWPPVTGPWVGSDDNRLWCRSEENHFNWPTPDPWMHRNPVQLTRAGVTS